MGSGWGARHTQAPEPQSMAVAGRQELRRYEASPGGGAQQRRRTGGASAGAEARMIGFQLGTKTASVHEPHGLPGGPAVVGLRLNQGAVL